MVKMSMPEPAIRHAMEKEKIDMDLIDEMCPNTVWRTPATQSEEVPDADETDDSAYGEEEEEEELGPDGDPNEWEETPNPDGEGVYYVNRTTWESSWVKPRHWDEREVEPEPVNVLKVGGLLDGIAGGAKLRCVRRRRCRIEPPPLTP
jgi:hypothetical protein